MIEDKIVLLSSVILNVWARFLCTILIATHDIYVSATVINVHDIVYNLHVLSVTSLHRLSIIRILEFDFVVNDRFGINVIFLGISRILINYGLLLLGVICVIICLVSLHVDFAIKSLVGVAIYIIEWLIGHILRIVHQIVVLGRCLCLLLCSSTESIFKGGLSNHV